VNSQAPHRGGQAIGRIQGSRRRSQVLGAVGGRLTRVARRRRPGRVGVAGGVRLREACGQRGFAGQGRAVNRLLVGRRIGRSGDAVAVGRAAGFRLRKRGDNRPHGHVAVVGEGVAIGVRLTVRERTAGRTRRRASRHPHELVEPTLLCESSLLHVLSTISTRHGQRRLARCD
jgi:hypothetical protein